MSKAKFVNDLIGIKDPDTLGEVNLCLYKHENGGMFAIDFSYLDQVAEVDIDDNYLISDPFNDNEVLTLVHDDDFIAWSDNLGEGKDKY